MLGAIVGDIVGSPYEYNNLKRKDFDFFSPNGFVTDDSVLTLAVCHALCQHKPSKGRREVIDGNRLAVR